MIVTSNTMSSLTYNVQADLARVPYLLDASFTWKISPALRLTVGQFKIPFSSESLVADNLDVPIERARAVNSLVQGAIAVSRPAILAYKSPVGLAVSSIRRRSCADS